MMIDRYSDNIEEIVVEAIWIPQKEVKGLMVANSTVPFKYVMKF